MTLLVHDDATYCAGRRSCPRAYADGHSSHLTPDDAGCWISSHAGWWAVVDLIRIAWDYGMPYTDDDYAKLDAWVSQDSADFDLDDFVRTLGDDAEQWLNENIAPEGYAFGWHDGEFFLQSDDWWAE